MQVSVETTSGLERRLTVGVPAEKVDSAVEDKLQEAKKNVRLDGFRPGKVPMREVKRRFGSAVRNDVLADVMREAFIEAVEQEKLQPAGMPGFEATTNEPGKDLEFVATFEVYPEVELQAFDGIAVEKPQADVSDEDVDTMIETLRQQRAQFEEVERAAEQGDRVNINYKGLKDGEAFEGGTADGQNLELGSGQMIPGFEDGIVGMKAGEEKDIDVTFPEEYHSEELKGQAVVFQIKVNKVEGKQLPEVDAEFMKAFGVDDGDEAKFKAEVRKNMERELKNAITGKVKEQVMEGLSDLHAFDLPAALVSQEVQRMRQQMVQQFGGGQQFDASILPDDLFTEQAQRSVRLGLIIRAILDQNELKADADKVKARVEEPEEVVNWVYGNPQQLQQSEGAVLEEQVVDLVLASAKVEEKTMSYQDAVKPREQAEA